MTQLPPFTGITAVCPKCTCLTISDSYRAQTPMLTWSGDTLDEITTATGGFGGECMLRTCTDCGYAWLEQCHDASKVESGELNSPAGT